jgi:hypothetical protein
MCYNDLHNLYDLDTAMHAAIWPSLKLCTLLSDLLGNKVPERMLMFLYTTGKISPPHTIRITNPGAASLIPSLSTHLVFEIVFECRHYKCTFEQGMFLTAEIVRFKWHSNVVV